MPLIEQSICYLALAAIVYVGATQRKHLESLARILMYGSACAIFALRTFS